MLNVNATVAQVLFPAVVYSLALSDVVAESV
jgi:hypothetical protein